MYLCVYLHLFTQEGSEERGKGCSTWKRFSLHCVCSRESEQGAQSMDVDKQSRY